MALDSGLSIHIFDYEKNLIYLCRQGFSTLDRTKWGLLHSPAIVSFGLSLSCKWVTHTGVSLWFGVLHSCVFFKKFLLLFQVSRDWKLKVRTGKCACSSMGSSPVSVDLCDVIKHDLCFLHSNTPAGGGAGVMLLQLTLPLFVLGSVRTVGHDWSWSSPLEKSLKLIHWVCRSNPPFYDFKWDGEDKSFDMFFLTNISQGHNSKEPVPICCFPA